MSSAEIYAKGYAFERYVKACKLIIHNTDLRRLFFVPRLQRQREELEKQYPDFPAALAAIHPRTAKELAR